jgi:hypothetical protein
MRNERKINVRTIPGKLSVSISPAAGVSPEIEFASMHDFIQSESKGHRPSLELLLFIRKLLNLATNNSVALEDVLREAFAEHQLHGGERGMASEESLSEVGEGIPSRSKTVQISGQLLQELPTEFLARRDAVGAIFDVVREKIAEAMEPAINAQAATMPQSTYEEKKALAKWLNAETRRLGLALKAPKTGMPCFLVATTGNHPSTGRFVFDYVDEQGRRQHPMSSATLPHLALMPADLSRISHGTRGTRR